LWNNFFTFKCVCSQSKGYQLIMLTIWKRVRKGVRKLACAAEASLPHFKLNQKFVKLKSC
ncbi:MAG: hypothetical protein ACE5K2_07275, partial [Candidatus Zixiibacteriota bacterium]